MPDPHPTETARAPELFRAALAQLVQIGMSVAQMVGEAAEAETVLAKAATTANIAEGVSPLATSLAEAIEADQAAAAAGEARRAVIARTQIVAAAFNQTARAIRRTILLAERIDRAWARPTNADSHAVIARRQIARAVTGAIARNAGGEQAGRFTETLAERLDSLDTLDDVTSRPAEDIIRDICRDLGLDPVRSMPVPAGENPAPQTGRPGVTPPPHALQKRPIPARARASPARHAAPPVPG